jgi:hypothetical protein
MHMGVEAHGGGCKQLNEIVRSHAPRWRIAAYAGAKRLAMALENTIRPHKRIKTGGSENVGQMSAIPH